MNKRLFSIALMVSAIPMIVFADGRTISLNKEDFTAAERVSPTGETLVKLKLSKSGKAKINRASKDDDVKLVFGEHVSHIKLKTKISGDDIQAGPFSSDEAQDLVHQVKGG